MTEKEAGYLLKGFRCSVQLPKDDTKGVYIGSFALSPL